jgi:D-lactate dehydrogenase
MTVLLGYMDVSFYSAQPYDRTFFDLYNRTHKILYIESPLNAQTAALATNGSAICAFVNDKMGADVLDLLNKKQVGLIALRCAGYNNVDLEAARRSNIAVVRVPAYSPHAVAEHAVALILTLNRKTHKAYNRVRESNFSLDKLLGFDLYKKTVGVIGTGRIGQAFCEIMLGFGCRVIAFDLIANRDLAAKGVEYLPLMDLLPESDIISLHCPLNALTRQIINEETLAMMKPGAMLINTSRGGLIDTNACIGALKSSQLGYLGVDVYEQEENLFYHDLSEKIILDDLIGRLMSFPNVLLTSHQGFFTKEALTEIAQATLQSISDFENGKALTNKV